MLFKMMYAFCTALCGDSSNQNPACKEFSAVIHIVHRTVITQNIPLSLIFKSF